MRKTTMMLFVFVLAIFAVFPRMAEAQYIDCNVLDEQTQTAYNNEAPSFVVKQLREVARQCWAASQTRYNAERRARRYGGYVPGAGGIYAGGYSGYYDPAYFQQMLNLPDALAACQFDFQTGQVMSCHGLLKEMSALQRHAEAHANLGEMYMTMHSHDGESHVRPIDDTNRQLGTLEAGGLGAGGGAAVGGAFGGRKGAAIGAVIGAVTGGVISSRNAHDNCVIISPQVMGNRQQTTAAWETSMQPVAGPAANDGSGQFVLKNETRMYIEAYDGETYLGRMSPGTTLQVGPPEDRYRGFVLLPNKSGGLSPDEADIQPSDTGWSFVEWEFPRS